MNNTKFNFELKKTKSTEQPPPINVIEPIINKDVYWYVDIFICYAALPALVLYVLSLFIADGTKLPVSLIFSYLVFFAILAKLLYRQIIFLYHQTITVFKFILICICWLIVAAIAIWVAILVFNTLSMPIASMPIWAVIILVWYVSSMYSK
jgi:hypothetical protein